MGSRRREKSLLVLILCTVIGVPAAILYLWYTEDSHLWRMFWVVVGIPMLCGSCWIVSKVYSNVCAGRARLREVGAGMGVVLKSGEHAAFPPSDQSMTVVMLPEGGQLYLSEHDGLVAQLENGSAIPLDSVPLEDWTVSDSGVVDGIWEKERQ